MLKNFFKNTSSYQKQNKQEVGIEKIVKNTKNKKSVFFFTKKNITNIIFIIPEKEKMV